MTKTEKIQSIALTTGMGPGRTARTHYLAEDRHSVFDLQHVCQRFPAVYSWIKAFLSPTLSWHTWKSQVPDAEAQTVVNLGAGTTRLHDQMINVDFAAFPHIDIVADFSEPLPIRSESVDAVLSISVFEHLQKAPLAVAEVARILKPGGVFYLATPFLYPFHGAPCDYTRWTLEGLRSLLGETFEIVASGSRGGPMGVVVLALSHTAGQLFCFGSSRLYSLVNFTCLGLLAPLKLLDLVLGRLPFNTNLCPGFYVTARKRVSL